MPVVGPIPQIVNADLDGAGLDGFAHHPMFKRAAEKLRKNRQHMKRHG